MNSVHIYLLVPICQYDSDCVIDDYVQDGVEYVVSKDELDKFLNSDLYLRARK